MDKEHLDRLEKTLNRYCKQHLSRGGTLIRGRYRTDNPLEYCPVRATIVLYNAPKRSWFDRCVDWVFQLFGQSPLPILATYEANTAYHEALSQAVGFPISYSECVSITHGIDSHIDYNPSLDPIERELFLLGRRLSEKYHPVAIP